MSQGPVLVEDGSMPGQLGRLAVPAVSVLLACVLLAALAVAALRSGTAGAPTVLVRGTAAAAATEDGAPTSLAVGDEVPRGATVTVGRDGAVLRVRGRDTWLSGGAVLRVLDGARQELRAGFVMVDARRGPSLEVTTY
jgi:alkylation response protein AidB-like acyl-CoA dehydrogenase